MSWGLLKAVSHVFPNSPQRFCLRHIYANFQRDGFRGEELKKLIFAASYSFTKSGFDKAMDALKVECEAGYNWLLKIPVDTWARHAFDTVCKTDLVVNNLSEVFNKMILDVRGKPIRSMIDGIKNKLMVRYSKTRDKAERTRWEITPFYAEKLEEAKKFSRECTAQNAEIGLWQVSTSGPAVHAVDIRARTCGCRSWDVTGIPCNHAISVFSKVKQWPEDHVHDFFKKPMYKEAYKYVVYPVPGPEDWPKTETTDIDPPVFRDKPGRKQTVRRKGAFEVPAPRDTSRMASITCSNCKLVGHKYTSCLKPLTPQLQMRRNQHKANRQVYTTESSSAPSVAPAPPARARAAPAPPARARAPAAPHARAPSAPPAPPARGRAAAAPHARFPSAPVAPPTRAPPAPKPPASSARPFSAPRATRADTSAMSSDAGTSAAPGRRLSSRTSKKTSRLLGYLNAGNAKAYKGSTEK